jgi:hypothetical protein
MVYSGDTTAARESLIVQENHNNRLIIKIVFGENNIIA